MAVPINNRGGRKSDKLWRDALAVASKREDPNGRVYLARIAEKCVQMAADGDISAIREIGDRLDGKPHQSVTTTRVDARQLSDAELLAYLSEDSGEGASQPEVNSQLTH